nr:hypothetical protein [Mucilaginibacter sp. L294]
MGKFKFFENGETEQIVTPPPNPDSTPRGSLITPLAAKEDNARYRVEQMTMTRMNGMIQSHAQTKREFVVNRKTTGNGMLVEVVMVENIINVFPEAFKEAIALVTDVDLVKSNVYAQVDELTGKVRNILNHQDIIEKWKRHKELVTEKFSFLRDPEAKNNLLKFLTVSESIIMSEKNLIEDLNTKLFYDLFFDKYLVNDEALLEPYSRTFYSQLFEGETATLDFTQQITGESAQQVNLIKTGILNRSSYNSSAIEDMYNQRYKPMIQYKFSEYNVAITEQILLDTTNRWIETAEVSIVEEVKNNIEILVDYKLRKIS